MLQECVIRNMKSQDGNLPKGSRSWNPTKIFVFSVFHLQPLPKLLTAPPLTGIRGETLSTYPILEMRLARPTGKLEPGQLRVMPLPSSNTGASALREDFREASARASPLLMGAALKRRF